MLKNTFVHMEGIGERTEIFLWSNGIITWEDCDEAGLRKVVGEGAAKKISMWAEKSLSCLDSGDHSFFSRTVPYEHVWRGWKSFGNRIGYLDIETTGLSPQLSKVTVVGVYDGEDVHSYVHGKNMDEFFADISKYSVLVTFNGKAFDIPFLKKHYPEVNFNHLHIDLRPVLKSLGIAGGLKKIEPLFGLERMGDMAGLTGYDAVKMWNRYEYNHDEAALDRLVRYNAEDILSLKPIMEWVFEKKSAEIRAKMRRADADGETGKEPSGDAALTGIATLARQ